MIVSTRCCICKEEQKILGLFFLHSCSRLWVDSRNSDFWFSEISIPCDQCHISSVDSIKTGASTHLLQEMGMPEVWCACIPKCLVSTNDEWVSACHTIDNISETKKMKVDEKFSEGNRQSTFSSQSICLKRTCLAWGQPEYLNYFPMVFSLHTHWVSWEKWKAVVVTL